MPITVDTLTISGSIIVPSGGISAQPRSSILQDANKIFPIPFQDLRIWDAFATVLTATANTDDLGLVGGTFGTAPPLVQAGDVKALGATTRYARVQVIIPECYQSAETLTIDITAGMKTTIADTTCTVDVECYRLDKLSGISADICATSAQTINSLTFAKKTFVITAASLVAGDVLDIRLTIATTDAATATAVIPTLAAIDLVADVQG
jgi:hypothetical protein